MADTPTCPECKIPLRPWSDFIYAWFCPCCSSRFHGSGQQVHWGSHNDYATYLCGPDRG